MILIGWNYQREPVGTTLCIPHYKNQSKGEMNLKTWIQTRERFGKSQKSSTTDHYKDLYNTQFIRQAVRSSKEDRKP